MLSEEVALLLPSQQLLKKEFAPREFASLEANSYLEE